MQDRTYDRAAGRVPLDSLLWQARSFTEGPPQAVQPLTSWETGRRFRNCSVHDFYEPFLRERRASEEESQMVQKWIADSIEVTLGVGDGGTLTMEELASRVTEAINGEGLSGGDRWALYELCFLLTAQMCTLKDEIFSVYEQSIRCGTPDEEEPLSLLRRVNAIRMSRTAPKAHAAPVERLSLEDLLGVARGNGHRLGEKARMRLPNLSIGPLMHCLLAARYDVRDDVDDDPRAMLAVTERTIDFEDMFRMYSGEDFDEDSSVAETAGVMTWKFRLDTESDMVSRTRVLQTYELCYEFISLMAREGCDEGHVTLMEREEDCAK